MVEHIAAMRGVPACRGAFLVVVLAGLCSLGGCAAAVPVVGTVAEPAVDESGKLIRWGKVESYQIAPYSETIRAARTAAQKLDLHYEREEQHPEQVNLFYVDERKQEIVVTVVRRTLYVTEIHTDAGLFGVEGEAQLLMHQILKELSEPPPTTNAKP